MSAGDINDHIFRILVLRNDDWRVCLSGDYGLTNITKAAILDSVVVYDADLDDLIA